MSRVTIDNFRRYDHHLKRWHRGDGLALKQTLQNFHQTEEAGAVAFYPVGGGSLEGKVKFSFNETPPASGDKGSSNPSTITGVSEVKVTRCGKNLIPYPYFESSATKNGLTFTVGADNSITVSGEASETTFLTVASSSSKLMKSGKTYTLSGCPSGGSSTSYSMRIGTGQAYDYGDGVTFTATDAYSGYGILIRIASGATITTPVVFRPQLELDSTAAAFEPYDGADYTIDLGSTYYGGEIDLATGLMTVTHTTVVFTGEENVTQAVYADGLKRYKISIPYAFKQWLSCVCSHYPTWRSGASENEKCYLSNPENIFFIDNSINTASDFKYFLATQYSNGTPVTVVYDIATPYTVQLDPLALTALAQTSRHEPRLSTVYTDADSIQITYQKSPIRTATEQEMAILGLGGNV